MDGSDSKTARTDDGEKRDIDARGSTRSKLMFSVVICTYNPGPKIRTAVESILNQDYPRELIQTIVVDDGSTQDIAKTLEGCDVKIIRHKKNMGLSTARNTGIANSTRDVVCFTDDDCIASRDWISNLAEAYKKDRAINGVGGQIVPYSLGTLLEKYSHLTKNPIYEHTRKMDSGLRMQNYLRNAFSTRRIPLKDGESIDSIMGANSSYMRTLLVKAGGCDSSFRRGVDWELNIRLKKAGGNFSYCEKAVVTHRHRSSWGSFFKHMYHYGRVYPQVVRKHPQVRYFPYPLPWLFLATLILCPLIYLFWTPNLPLLAKLGVRVPVLLGTLLVPLIYLFKETPYAIRSYRSVRSVSFIFALPWIELAREFVYDMGSVYTIITRRGLPPPGERWDG